MKKTFTFVLLSIFTLTLNVISTGAWAIEEPAFDLVKTKDGIEYRKYPPYLVAETLVSGELSRSEASSIGFRRLFKYIRGANQTSAKIDMTAPVRQTQESTKIAMTAPVRQNKTNGDWSIAFVLPAQFTKENAPQPTSPDISVKELPGQVVAVLRYSGRWTNNNVNNNSATLLAILEDSGVKTSGDISVAYYNSPFSLPFMRRNEVMITVVSAP